MSSYPAADHYRAPKERGGFAGAIVLLLGLAVGVLVIVLVVVARSADQARDDAAAATAQAGTPATHDHAAATSSAQSLPLASFAGKAAPNAEALAKAHAAYPAALPAVPAGDLVKVQMTLKDMTVEIAPGVRYNTWAFDGHGAPGPIVHVREGQTVEMTLKNGGAIPHSIDFHAARIAPNVAFRDVAPGDSFTFRFKAGDPGVYMYHCGTKPVLAHIANGMYGAIVVDPAKPLPKADNEYVLVASEWYLNERRPQRARVAEHGEGARRWRPTGRPSTATRTSTSRTRSPPTRARRRASTSSPPARRSTPTSTSSARSSTGPG